MIMEIIENLIRFVLFYGFLYFGKKLSKKQFLHKRWIFIYILGYSIFYSIFSNFISAELSLLISLLSTTIAYRVFLNIENKDLVFYSIILWIVAITLDITVMNTVNFIVNTWAFGIDNCRMIGSIFMATMYFVLGNIRLFIRIVDNIKKFLFGINYSIYILILLLISYFVLGAFCFNYMSNQSIIILILIIAISIIFIIVLFVTLKMQISALKDNIEILTKNNAFYIERIDECRIIKHNLIANLSTLKSTANKKTCLLIDELIKKYNSKLQMPVNIKNLPTGVNGIIYEKIYNNNDKKLSISINNKIDNNIIEVLSARKYSLFCEALQVVLDNAIEASSLSNEKILYIEFMEVNNEIRLKIINTFTGTIDIDALGTKNYTSKKKGNGLGLFSILHNKSVIVTTSIKGNKFNCTLKVKKT